MANIKYETFMGQQQVCRFLNAIKARGYNIANWFVKITEDRGGYFTVFYDEQLDKTPDSSV